MPEPDPASATSGETRVPEATPGVNLRALPLSPVEAFVFSRIDGSATEADIAVATGLDGSTVAQALDRLASLGAITLRDRAARASSRILSRAPQVPTDRPSDVVARGPQSGGGPAQPGTARAALPTQIPPSTARPVGPTPGPLGARGAGPAPGGARSVAPAPAPASTRSVLPKPGAAGSVMPAPPGARAPAQTAAPPASGPARPAPTATGTTRAAMPAVASPTRPGSGAPESSRVPAGPVAPVPVTHLPASLRAESADLFKRYLSAAHVALEDDNPLAAANFYRLAQQLAPSDALIRDALAACAAVNARSRADADQVGALVKKGDDAARAQQWTTAAAAYEEAAALAPKDAKVLYKAAGALFRLGKGHDRAVAHARVAAQLAPDRFDTWLLLAYLHHDAGSYAAAREALQRAGKLKPDDARVTKLLEKLRA